jgi:hypothetical protein
LFLNSIIYNILDAAEQGILTNHRNEAKCRLCKILPITSLGRVGQWSESRR